MVTIRVGCEFVAVNSNHRKQKTGARGNRQCHRCRTAAVLRHTDQLLRTAPNKMPNVRFGSKADICSAKGHVRFTPDNDRESGFPHKVMSALPPKADMCSALARVCFGPIADSCSEPKRSLFDHLVGAGK